MKVLYYFFERIMISTLAFVHSNEDFERMGYAKNIATQVNEDEIRNLIEAEIRGPSSMRGYRGRGGNSRRTSGFPTGFTYLPAG